MATAIKTQLFATAVKQSEHKKYPEPKRLSKVGQWMRDNPGGIIIVKDRQAVNR
jgi:hypothetical protein